MHVLDFCISDDFFLISLLCCMILGGFVHSCYVRYQLLLLDVILKLVSVIAEWVEEMIVRTIPIYIGLTTRMRQMKQPHPLGTWPPYLFRKWERKWQLALLSQNLSLTLLEWASLQIWFPRLLRKMEKMMPMQCYKLCLAVHCLNGNSGNNSDFRLFGECAMYIMGVSTFENVKREITMGNLAPSTSQSKLSSQFIRMGFSPELVTKAIEETGEENPDLILETLLNVSALDGLVQKDTTQINPESPITEEDYESDIFSDEESCVADEDVEDLCEKEDILAFLLQMGYNEDEVKFAINRCGQDATVSELQDMIFAARLAKEADADFDELSFSDDNEEKPSAVHGECSGSKRKGKWTAYSSFSGKPTQRQKVFGNSELSSFCPPTHMIGFGVPNEPFIQRSRDICDAAVGPPYFYYENVALAPKNAWETISHFLYGIEPEFVDSKFFCAAARKRGYIHNLPIHNRFPVEPQAPLTIQEALPHTKKWWPSWDPRFKLNCIQGCSASSRTMERIRVALSESTAPPPLNVRKYVIDECKKWNLVWVGVHKVAPLEPDEIEMLLGFPKNHTRGGGISRTDRYRSLGNSFQVDTVAYHLSVLKNIFPDGIRVLSLFSGIGGAEVALHRLGIFMKVVVSVEISEVNRNILRSWWDQTDQKGTLIDIVDVRDVSTEKLQRFISTFGGFDLVVGGSPCNNLSGSNRVSRDGLEGKHSSLFFDYSRILDDVKMLMK